MNLTKIIFGLNSLDHLYSSHPPMSSHSSLQAFYLQVFLGAPLAPFLARLCLICPQAWASAGHSLILRLHLPGLHTQGLLTTSPEVAPCFSCLMTLCAHDDLDVLPL